MSIIQYALSVHPLQCIHFDQHAQARVAQASMAYSAAWAAQHDMYHLGFCKPGA